MTEQSREGSGAPVPNAPPRDKTRGAVGLFPALENISEPLCSSLAARAKSEVTYHHVVLPLAMAICRPKAIDDAPIFGMAAERLSCLLRGMGEAQGKKVESDTVAAKAIEAQPSFGQIKPWGHVVRARQP